MYPCFFQMYACVFAVCFSCKYVENTGAWAKLEWARVRVRRYFLPREQKAKKYRLKKEGQAMNYDLL